MAGVDFARQLAEHRREAANASRQHQTSRRQFKSSAAPKGTNLPAGYQDRARQRQAQNEAETEEDVAKRTVLGDADRDAVKGLDWDLLRRARAGEDVSTTSEARVRGPDARGEDDASAVPAEDVDEEFDRLLEEKGKEGLDSAGSMAGSGGKPVKTKKKGNIAPAAAVAVEAAVPRSRDEILRQLKASRAAAAAATAAAATSNTTTSGTESTLSSKFKRIGETRSAEKQRWIEQDETGRRKEVLLTVDAQGKTKRKVRWLDKPGATATALDQNGLLVPDKLAKPLGIEVPVVSSKGIADSDHSSNEDIFDEVGAEYNPLAGLDDDDGSSEGEERDEHDDDGRETDAISTAMRRSSKEFPPLLQPPKATEEAGVAVPGQVRNYFATTADKPSEPAGDRAISSITEDPNILAALKRAAALRPPSSATAVEDETEADEALDEESLLRRRKFIEEARRRDMLDAMDMDLGFGSSRVADEEDDDAVLWDDGRGSKKRKRGPKKKKGDKDSAADVLRVIERRKNDSG